MFFHEMLFFLEVCYAPSRVPTLRSLFLQIALVLHRRGDVIIPVDLGSKASPAELYASLDGRISCFLCCCCLEEDTDPPTYAYDVIDTSV